VASEGSYGVNNNIIGSNPSPRALADIPKPANVFLSFDSAWYVGAGSLDPPVSGAMRHLGGMNFCYADGHIKFHSRDRILSTAGADFFP
jgi:prepilin-type processing-associated H-X9-DG protein